MKKQMNQHNIIVNDVVKKTTNELKKIGDFGLQGAYMMIDSCFSGVIKKNNGEVIIIKPSNDIEGDVNVHCYRTQESFQSDYPTTEVNIIIPESYTKFLYPQLLDFCINNYDFQIHQLSSNQYKVYAEHKSNKTSIKEASYTSKDDEDLRNIKLSLMRNILTLKFGLKNIYVYDAKNEEKILIPVS